MTTPRRAIQPSRNGHYMIKMEPVIAFTICSLLIGTGFNTAPWLNYIERDPTGMSAYYHPTDDRDYFSLLDNAKNLPNELRDRFIPFQIAQIAFHPAAEEFDVRALEHLLPLAFERLKETSDVTIQRRYQAAIALVVCNSGYRNQTTKGVMNLFDAEPSVYLWFERLRQWEIKHKFRLSNIDIFMGTLWIYREGRIAEEDFLKVAEQARRRCCRHWRVGLNRRRLREV